MADPNFIPQAANGVHAPDGGDGIDYSDKFKICEVFHSVDEAFSYANEIAQKLGFSLVKASNHKNQSDSRIRNIVKCERSGVFVSRANPNTRFPRPKRSTKKCNCPFAIKIVERKEDRGIFDVMPKTDCGFHNHKFIPYGDGNPRKAALTDEMKNLVEEQTQALVWPRSIRTSLIKKFGKGDPNFCAPSNKSIYNVRCRMSAKMSGDRNRGQQMLSLAREHKYIFYTEVDEFGSLSDIFMCHPESVSMYRAYPYVVVMDSTYKTNKYDLPLVEMIGVSPVGKNFLIAYALVANETKERYEWVLRCLNELLPEGLHPTTIVTDRELGLMSAIKTVFPNANHLLCTFHIYNAVEKYALRMFKDNEVSAHICTYRYFANVVNAGSEEDFNKAWEEFKQAYNQHWPRIVKYIETTWMDEEEEYIKKWARCFTNKVLHFQNTATSRVEAAHAVLKTWLGSSRVSCDTLWRRAHEMMESQHAKVRKLLSDSVGKTKVDNSAGAHARLFAHLSGDVSHLAIQHMCDEYDRGVELGVGLYDHCGCAISTTHGLPCACFLHFLDREGWRVNLDVVQRFWKTLVYGDHPVARFTTREDEMRDMFNDILHTDPSLWPGIQAACYVEMHPEREDVGEPNVSDTRKGRPSTQPRRRSTTRNRTCVEHARARANTTPIPQRIRINYTPVAQAPLEDNYWTTEDASNLPLRTLVPGWFRDFFEAYFDPRGDGHCGYRCLSHAVHGTDLHWQAIRNALHAEMISRNNYAHIYGHEFEGALERILWTRGDRPCGPGHWLTGIDLYAFATLHHWTVCVVHYQDVQGVRSWEHSCTYLPVYTPPHVPEPLGEVWLLTDNKHWRRIHVDKEAPMPPINVMWNHHVDQSVLHLRNHYANRLDVWAVHEGHVR